MGIAPSIEAATDEGDYACALGDMLNRSEFGIKSIKAKDRSSLTSGPPD